MIAGFERPDAGSILLDGRDLAPGRPAQAAGQHGLPVLRALPVPRRLRQRRVRAALPARRNKRGRASPGRRGAGAGADRLAAPSASRTSCPAASSSASRWPGRWSSSRRCSSSTSRWALLTRSCASSSRSSCGHSSARSGRPSSTSPTTRRRRSPCPTGSPSCVDGRVEQVGTPTQVYCLARDCVRRRLPRHREPARGECRRHLARAPGMRRRRAAPGRRSRAPCRGRRCRHPAGAPRAHRDHPTLPARLHDRVKHVRCPDRASRLPRRPHTRGGPCRRLCADRRGGQHARGATRLARAGQRRVRPRVAPRGAAAPHRSARGARCDPSDEAAVSGLTS